MVKRIAWLGVGTLAATVAALGLTAGSAQASGSATGKVISKTNLNTRSGPSTTGRVVGSSKPGTHLRLTCKVHGPTVGGNNIWYRLPGEHKWVSARYVVNVGGPPAWCLSRDSSAGSPPKATGVAHGTVHARGGLRERIVPSTRASASSPDSVANRSRVGIDCQIKGTGVRGDRSWYKLATKSGGRWRSGLWVSGAYVHVNGKQPRTCKPGVHTRAGVKRSGKTYQGPSSNDRVAQRVTKGQRVGARCFTSIHVPRGHDQDWIATKNSGWVRRNALTGTTNVPVCSEVVKS